MTDTLINLIDEYAAPAKACVCGEPQAPGTVHRVDGPCYVTEPQPAPATQQAGDVVAYLDVGAGGYLDLGSTLSEDALQQLPKGRHALVIAGTYGIDGYVAAPQPSPTTKPAPQQEVQEPYAYAVYFPDQPKVELVHDLDELIDDLTNRQHTVTKLYTAPQPAPAPLSDDVLQKTWALIDELEKLRGADRYDEDWVTLNKRDSELRAALDAQGDKR